MRGDSARALFEALVPGSEPGNALTLTAVKGVNQLGSLDITEDGEEEDISPRDAVTDDELAVNHLRLDMQVLDSLLEEDERVDNLGDAVIESHTNVGVAGTVAAESKEGQQVVVANGLLQALEDHRGQLHDLDALEENGGVRSVRGRRENRDKGVLSRDASNVHKEVVNVVENRDGLEQSDTVTAVGVDGVGALVSIHAHG